MRPFYWEYILDKDKYKINGIEHEFKTFKKPASR